VNIYANEQLRLGAFNKVTQHQAQALLAFHNEQQLWRDKQKSSTADAPLTVQGLSLVNPWSSAQ
jgi:hypothetical protein